MRNIASMINERRCRKANKAANSSIILPLELRPRKLSTTSGSLRSTSTDALSVRKIGKEMNFLHNVAATHWQKASSLCHRRSEKRAFIVVPLVPPAILVLIEIEKSIVFVNHKLPGISTLIRTFLSTFSTLSSFISIFFKCTRKILFRFHMLVRTPNLSCLIRTNMSNEKHFILFHPYFLIYFILFYLFIFYRITLYLQQDFIYLILFQFNLISPSIKTFCFQFNHSTSRLVIDERWNRDEKASLQTRRATI